MPVDTYDAPGSYELPLQAKFLAESGHYAAIVAATVIDGLMRVQLDTSIPAISMVLTPHHFHESNDHRQFFLDHFKMKGTETASTCLRAITALAKISAQSAKQAL